MNIGRIFVSAVVRRVAYVLVALLLAWIGLGRAEAAIYSNEGAAKSACLAAQVAATVGNRTPVPTSCQTRTVNGGYGLYTCYVWNQVNTYACKAPDNNFQWAVANNCTALPPYIGPPPASTAVGVIRNGSLTCVNGCTATWAGNGDGTFTGLFDGGGGGACSIPELKEFCDDAGETGMHWNAWIQACEPTPTACTGNQVKDPATGECKQACPVGMVVNPDGQCDPEGDSCPAGQIKSPQGACLPGDGQCAAGEAKRPDGTCGKDSDGDGVADDDDDDPDNDSDKETFSGGESCDVPPSCSGSPVMCGQARIQWRIDCNTRKNRSVTGGGCNAIPVCTGKDCDAMEYSQLLLQWRATCALESAGSGGGGGGSDADIAAIKDALTGSSQGDPGGAGNPQDGWQSGGGGDYEPDQSGYGWSSSCPANPQVSVFGNSLEFNLQPACSWISLGGLIAMAITALGCLRVVAGRAT